MNIEGFQIALDRRTDRVVHIDEVEEGFEFAVCPECKLSLVASNRNPNSRLKATYFRHLNKSNCSGESLIHRWGKQVIADKLRVLGARYVSVGSAKDLAKKVHNVEILQESESLDLESCELEKSIEAESQIRPDISAKLKNGENLYIEIFVSNAVNDLKKQFYQKPKLGCLEIDLSHLPPDALNSSKNFESYVIDTAPRKWIFCSLYSGNDERAQLEADQKAKLETETIKKQREEKRNAKNKWRAEHNDFIKLVEAYLVPENQDKVSLVYDQCLGKSGNISNKTKVALESKYTQVPDIVNIPVKGELGFHCHRVVWQWEIYKRVVIEGYREVTAAMNAVKATRATRGYEESMKMSAWYDSAPKWSPERLYWELINVGIQINRICSEAEKIVGEPILVEKDRPQELFGLKVAEWREMPKPVCVIRRYLRELTNKSILETVGDEYIIKHGSKPPLCRA